MPGLSIEWASEQFVLLPQRALYWPGERALLLADLHIGKPAAFRAWGLPVPPGTTQSSLAELDRLLEETGAARLLILGDLLHARAGREATTLDAVTAWRERNASIEIVLLRGNHDRSAGDPPQSWRIDCRDGPLNVRKIALVHDPHDAPRGTRPFLAGHIHPVVSLSDIDGTSFRLPCFCFGKRRGLLPAFGAFTGGGRFEVQPGDRLFLAADDHVVEAPGGLLQGAE